MPLPSFLCIGAQKAGTSWLFVQMSKHPEIWMPPVKELHLFDHLYVESNRAWTTGHIRRGVLSALKFHLGREGQPDWSYIRYLVDLAANRMFTDAWYLRCFDRPKARDRMCGDITPEYSTIPEEGIQHVKRLLPGVKIIYIVRDPVERALSQLRMNVERRGIQPDTGQLLTMCDEPDIDNRGNYRAYIPSWQKYFDPASLLILPYGNIRTQPAIFMERIEQHLGIKHFSGYSFGDKVHESKKFDIPLEVTEKLTERYRSQSEYLSERFGADFLLQTR